MDKQLRGRIERFVHENVTGFHAARVKNLAQLKLKELLKNKNPYLFRAKNLNTASAFIEALLEARLSSSEEGSFGKFMEALANHVAQLCGNAAEKSPATGIDIDLKRDGIRYLISVKSGNNWGNSSQHKKLKDDFKTAVKVLKQDKYVGELQPTLGICYGNFATKNTGEYLHIGGQSFWQLISGDPELYVDLVEPLGHEAELHDRAFREQKDAMINRLVREFTLQYCDEGGAIDWKNLVQFVSQNVPTNKAKGAVAK